MVAPVEWTLITNLAREADFWDSRGTFMSEKTGEEEVEKAVRAIFPTLAFGCSIQRHSISSHEDLF